MAYAVGVRRTLHRPGTHDSHEEPRGSHRTPTPAEATRSPRAEKSSRAKHRPQVHSITGAPLSPRVDQNNRLRNYLISMTIRTICFLLAGVFAITSSWTWLAWVCIIAAAILPYPAVVFANAVDRRRETVDLQAPYLMLEAGPTGEAPSAPPTQTRPADPPPPPATGRWYSG